VRELTLVAQRMLTLHGHRPQLRLADLADIMPDLAQPAPTAVESPPRRRDHRVPKPEEISELLAALERHDGVVARAAEELGITRQRAYRLIEASKSHSP
jgi:transcriptional regulator with PAS, ATPase and Fis domain